MATYTTNLNLKKPGAADSVNIDDINGNMDAIDTAVQGNIDSISAMLGLVYPVGSIYTSVSSTNPNTLFGGTWSAFGEGKVLVGIDAADTAFDTVEETGGAKTGTFALGANGYAKIGNDTSNNAIVMNASSSTNQSANLKINTLSGVGWGTYTANQMPTLGGTTQSGSLVQPYIVVYMWKRTA